MAADASQPLRYERVLYDGRVSLRSPWGGVNLLSLAVVTVGLTAAAANHRAMPPGGRSVFETSACVLGTAFGLLLVAIAKGRRIGSS